MRYNMPRPKPPARRSSGGRVHSGKEFSAREIELIEDHARGRTHAKPTARQVARWLKRYTDLRAKNQLNVIETDEFRLLESIKHLLETG